MMLLLLSAGNWLCMQPLIDLCLSQFLRHHSSKQKREFCSGEGINMLFHFFGSEWKIYVLQQSGREVLRLEGGCWITLTPGSHRESAGLILYNENAFRNHRPMFFFDSSASEEKPVWPRNMVLLLYNWLDVLTDRHHGYSNLYLDHFYSTGRRWDSADYLISPINLIIIFILFYKMWECVE